MKHIFISYKREERDYVAALASVLEANGYAVWWDHDIEGGESWEDKIKEGLDQAFAALIVVTPEGEESKWMQNEQYYATDRELPLIPLLRRGKLWFRLMRLQAVDGRRSTLDNPVPDGLFGALLKYAPHELPADLRQKVTTNEQFRRRLIPDLVDLAEQVNSPQGLAAREVLQQWAVQPPDSLARMARAALEGLPPLPNESYRPSTPADAHREEKRRSRRPLLIGIGVGIVALVIVLLVGVMLLIGPIQPARSTPTVIAAVPTSTATAVPLSGTDTENTAEAEVAPRQSATTNAQGSLTRTFTATFAPSLTKTLTPTIPTQTLRPTIPTKTFTPTPVPTTAATFTATVTPKPEAGTVRTDARGVTQVYVPAGCFQMGSDPAKDPLAQADQQPQHEVCIPQGYWIDAYEVTNASYLEFMRSGGYARPIYWTTDGWQWVRDNTITGPSNYDGFVSENQPRVGVSWYEADAYARWRGCRLPTEAQWEYAARGVQSLIYPWGNTWDGNRTKANMEASATIMMDIGSYPNGKSWVGAYDMAGNAWEWVNDWYNFGYYQLLTKNDPSGPTSGASRVVRGGAFDADAILARSSYRTSHIASYRAYDQGFRIVCDLSPR